MPGRASSSSSGVPTTSSTRPSSRASAGRNCRPSSSTLVSASTMPSIRTVRVTPPAPGSRPSVTSGKPIRMPRVVHHDPVVAGQRDLQAAAERRAVDRRDHRPAEPLQAAQLRLDRVQRRGERGRVRAGHPDHLLEVAAGEERRLGRGDDHPGDGVALGLQPVEHRTHRARRRRRSSCSPTAPGRRGRGRRRRPRRARTGSCPGPCPRHWPGSMPAAMPLRPARRSWRRPSRRRCTG